MKKLKSGLPVARAIGPCNCWVSLGLAVVLSCPVVTAQAQQGIATGDLSLDYEFAPTGERMPYRLYVPTSYDGSRPYPLVVVLHGGGGDQNGDFDTTRIRDIAEESDVIALAPLGYHRFGGYGSIFPIVTTPEAMAAAGQVLAPAVTIGEAAPLAEVSDDVSDDAPDDAPDIGALPPAAAEPYVEMPHGMIQDAVIGIYSEQEVLLSMEEVMRHYRIDPTRVYLTGNSMGGAGTQYLAAKYSEKWAAVATGGLPVAEWAYPFRRLRSENVAIMYVHGELDNLSNAHWSEVLWQRARAEGVEGEFMVVEGGTHGSAWGLALPEIFAFLLRHSRE